MAEAAEVPDKGAISQGLIDDVNGISSIPTYRAAVKRPYCNQARMLKLLNPHFEEIKEVKEPLPEETIGALVSLKEGLNSAKELLRFGSEGSKIYLVLEREQIIEKYNEVTAQLEQALSAIPLEKRGISDEAKEQVELVLAQFQREKRKDGSP